ncbi:LAMI_0G03070g1_1 [Lachancea mirantina]|uniref:Protein YAE1 n=1 Tax=Lachancea mirantina TaxID=1230905 RepID=A0A1G4K809_9SACH|nr:LAMI_0G03070g1_1 [Lachancea mirantina]
MTSVNDIWTDDFYDDTSSHAQNESPEVKKLRYSHSKRGYLDGITSSKEENLQTGFNASFPEGSTLGIKVGYIIGTLHMLSVLYGEDDKSLLQKNEQAKRELGISKILSKSEFTENCELIASDSGEHRIIDKWLHTVDELKKRYFTN